jgi:hypothetical protein
MSAPRRRVAERLPAPRLFIASASESLGTAEALQRELAARGIVSDVWNRSFQLSRTNIENLEAIAANVSGAIFLMGHEDVRIVRRQVQFAARDNVLLELGLFAGKLGRSHCVILRPRMADWRWPSDLDGVSAVELSAGAFRPAAAVAAAHGKVASTFKREIGQASTQLCEHFMRVERHRWGQIRADVGYFLRAVRETYVNRLLSQRSRSSFAASGRTLKFRLNVMTPSGDRGLYIACVDYESDFHEDEFITRWGEKDGKCGYAWKHGVQALYGSDLDIAEASKAPMNQAKLPPPARNRRSVLSTPVFWRDTPVGILNFDSSRPAMETSVHRDGIRECFQVAAGRIATLLHGRR